MVESFCNSYYIPDEVHPTAPGWDRTITQFPEGKVLTRVLDLAPSVAVFRAFYTRIYSDGLFSFAKRSISAPSCLLKPLDSIKNWADHFFWVDSRVFPIPVSLYMGGALEKDPAPHLTARQEQAFQVLSSNKAPFRRYSECFLVLVGLSPYYLSDENTYPAFERPDRTDMGLLDYIRTADPRKVQAVEVQKGEEQVKLLDSIKHCFVSLDAPAAVQQASGSGSGAGPEVSAPSAKGNVVAEENKGDAARKQPEKAKRKKLLKQSDTLPAKRLRIDHPSLASGTDMGKTLRHLSRTWDGSSPAGDLVRQTVGHFVSIETRLPYTKIIILKNLIENVDYHCGCGARQGLGLREKDVEIARLKSLVKEKQTESAEVPRLRDQVSVLAADKSFLSAEVSALKSVVSQKDTDISLLESLCFEP
ncbi:hypothetical protein Tco_0998016 [Tanacetum coccineum]